jgi:hypothetical protein
MNETKPTLLYFDHSPHKRTKSTYFLSEILKTDFNVTTIWDDEWDLDSDKAIMEINKYDYVVFVQILPQIGVIRKIISKIIWVPMLDGVIWWPDIRWQLLSSVPMKIISFSHYLSDITRKWDIDTLNLQIYLNPNMINPIKRVKKVNIFFWQRANLTFNTIKKYINFANVNKCILRLDQSDGIKKYIPDCSDVSNYKLEVIKGDIGQTLHLKKIDECNIFIAPRYFEGIGWSFIEAMAKGMAVVAFDNPTMNEYIQNGINGYLINEKKPEILDLSRHTLLGLQARKDCEKGYRKWLNDLKNISLFITSKNKEYPTNHPENNLIFRIKYYLHSQVSDWKFKHFLAK